MSRSVFEDGRILRTSDFVADQADHLNRHRLHNNGQHRWGIVAGLEIVNTRGELAVEAGRAVDGYGRDLVLAGPQALDLRQFEQREVDEVDVWLVYQQNRLEVRGGVDRVSDGARIELRDADGALDARRPKEVPRTDLDAAAPVTTDDPKRLWPVYLGRIIRNSGQEDGEPVLELGDRPYAGLIGATVRSPLQKEPWIDLGAGTSGTLEVRFEEETADGVQTAVPLSVGKDGVVFDRQLTVSGNLVLRGGSVVLDPFTPKPGDPVAAIPDWAITHVVGGTDHELRITMPEQVQKVPGNPGETLPTRLTVGQVRDGEFVISMAVEENGTVVIGGNLIVGGNVRATSVQAAELSEEAEAQLAAVRANSVAGVLAALRATNPELRTA
ncbi:hypothetical protein AB0C07_37075 [Actinoplanes missouriensis]|uniref:hypothetical protein n=1 Tax=Actinoplanes missouriensis TaxID=1866 RepID=UPI0033D8C5F0